MAVNWLKRPLKQGYYLLVWYQDCFSTWCYTSGVNRVLCKW